MVWFEIFVNECKRKHISPIVGQKKGSFRIERTTFKKSGEQVLCLTGECPIGATGGLTRLKLIKGAIPDTAGLDDRR